MSKRVLVFGAHPDDIEWGMGGTILKMRNEGYEVFIVDMTRGEAAKTGTPEERYIEAQRAAKRLGACRTVLDMGDKRMQPDQATAATVLGIIRKINPDLIYAPYWEDKHPDHAAVGKVLKPYATAFYVLRASVQPSHVVDITDVIKEKKSILWEHASQVRTYWETMFWKKHENTGKEAGAKYAEAFILNEDLTFMKEELPEFL